MREYDGVSERRRKKYGIVIVLVYDCDDISVVGGFYIRRIGEDERRAEYAAAELAEIRIKRIRHHFILRPVERSKRQSCKEQQYGTYRFSLHSFPVNFL